MTTLPADSPRKYLYGDQTAYPVIASDVIYEGAAVGENGSGYARPLQAGDRFLGFNIETADNSAGSAGDIDVTVKTKGKIQLAVASAAITDNDRPAVYASDDDTFTLVASGNSHIGYVERFVSSGVAIVEFDAALVGAAV
ncbi:MULTISPECIES: hypothetical protein [Mameliella]|jgi:hypothetical protein|uniref:Uncharacterized protein n=1 Tax=Mameliella alba TaxID=561184 RepID=A0A0B3SII5_9RHOB|nr:MULTISPECIES: hypothetical protein [Mameliella]KHQ50379.1 hypothetical protein OA50_05054 [Mameliella alba]MBW4984130.1 hypothetical protein [Mameliella sp. CS4]ODM46136.1 cytoplasmic protein [Ruegeria sp. PBVC088]